MPPRKTRSTASTKSIETLVHEDATRKNIPTAEYQSVLDQRQQEPIPVRYPRADASGLAEELADRNRDLDPQLVWRGKDEQDWSDLVVQAPPLYIQEKIHPKVLIDDLLRQTRAAQPADDEQIDLFSDFNGLPDSPDAKTEFYQHDAHWSNRMILGDSLQVMASLAEREGLRGKVQCIYFDPPYGIKFNSNFQWSTASRDVKDGKADNITREPEQVKAFRDTWRDGIHSYLTYLRDRLTVARDLLTESGSIFVQIGDENVHRVRAVMDEVFGEENFISAIAVTKTTSATSRYLPGVIDHILWYGRKAQILKYRVSFASKDFEAKGYDYYVDESGTIHRSEIYYGVRLASLDNLTSQSGGETTRISVSFEGSTYAPRSGGWKTSVHGIQRLQKSKRIGLKGRTLRYVRCFEDFPVRPRNNTWNDISTGGFVSSDKLYVVQTNEEIVKRCILMTTDPGDLVLDPTMGSGTTAYVAEQWGRRWITIDTSRVATALARARIMGARYPYYLLADSPEGQQKEAEITRSEPSASTTRGDVRHGFVYERVPHITLKSIANNAEIDVIWENFEQRLKPLRERLSAAIGKKETLEEWEIPRERPTEWPQAAEPLLTEFWRERIARQKEIDASIAARADVEYLYDKPYEDKKKVRVAGPFTVESLSPHRVLTVDENDELIDQVADSTGTYGAPQTFEQMILDNLKMAGVQQAKKEDKIVFTSLIPWPGDMISADGRYEETGNNGDGKEKRAAIFIGPEFGTVTRMQLVEAAKEAGDAGFDVLISCAFAYDAHSTDLSKIGRIQILKARMNADLHMATDLKNTGKGNLFVIFGEPDIKTDITPDGQVVVEVLGVDVFKPSTGEVESSNADDIACWFVDTNYNEESFFVRQAYFGGTAQDPYKGLKTALKAEINPEAWETIYSTTSRPFPKPETGKIAVKVINHLGDEVMKVFRIGDAS